MTRLIPPRRNEIVTPSGEMTQRFSEYLESVANLVNAQASIIDASPTVSVNSYAGLVEINLRLGSGDALTCDSDSFTCDSDIFYCDMDEA
jgi:hypothetical protein